MIIPVFYSPFVNTDISWLLQLNEAGSLLSSQLGDKSLENSLNQLNTFNQFGNSLIFCENSNRFSVAESVRKAGAPVTGIYVQETVMHPLIQIACAAHRCEPADILLCINQSVRYIDFIAFIKQVVEAEPEAVFGNLVQFRAEKGELVQDGMEFDNSEVETFSSTGVYMMRAGEILSMIKNLSPEIYYLSQQAIEFSHDDLDFVRLSHQHLALCPQIESEHFLNLDKQFRTNLESRYLSKTPKEWNQLWTSMNKNKQGNVLDGRIFTHHTVNSYLVAGRRSITGVGLENMIVIDSADSILVADMAYAAALPNLLETVKADVLSTNKISKTYRPWGYFESLEQTDSVQVKRLVVSPGARLSLQSHQYRSEHWVVIQGNALVRNGDNTFNLHPSESTFIPAQTIHQLTNEGEELLEIIEVQTGSYFGEDDIERFEDDYGRIKAA
jgi:mannose-1-phosphate guanylyltransferase/mannose-6-phosphate isomerase